MKFTAKNSVNSPIHSQMKSHVQEAGHVYIAPEIKVIQLDNEISLALESNPPEGPGEGALTVNDTLNRPFKDNFFR